MLIKGIYNSSFNIKRETNHFVAPLEIHNVLDIDSVSQELVENLKLLSHILRLELYRLNRQALPNGNRSFLRRQNRFRRSRSRRRSRLCVIVVESAAAVLRRNRIPPWFGRGGSGVAVVHYMWRGRLNVADFNRCRGTLSTEGNQRLGGKHG